MSKLKELIEQLCPDGVEYKTFGECGEFYGGLTGKTKKDFGEGSPFLTYMGIFAHTAARFDCVDYVRLKDGETQNAVHRGDVLITVSSETPDECGMTCVVTKEPEETTYLNSFCTGWRPYDVDFADPDYLKYALRSHGVRQQIVRTANGVTRFNVSKPLLAKVSFPVPPIEVQREIVRILDSMQELDDALSEELDRRQVQQRYFTGCFQDAGWDINLLGNIAESMNTGPFGSALHKEDYVEEGFPIVNPENIDNGRLVATSRIPMSKADELKRYWLKPGDIVIGRRGEMGRAAIVPDDGEQWVCGTGCFFIRFDSEVNSEFVNLVMGTNGVRDYLEQNAVGSTMKNLNLKILASTPILFPERETQDRLVSQLSDMTQLCDVIDAELQARRKQFEYYRDKLLDFPEKVA